jgi:hypothetical protein
VRAAAAAAAGAALLLAAAQAADQENKSSSNQPDEPVGQGEAAGQSAPDVSDGIFVHRCWKLASHPERQLSICQLKLFELLGVDPRVMLWCARAPSGLNIDCAFTALDALLVLLEIQKHEDDNRNLAQVLAEAQQATTGCAPQTNTQQAVDKPLTHLHDPQRLQRDSKLHLLLPTVLLPFARNPASHISDSTAALRLFERCLGSCGFLSCTAAKVNTSSVTAQLDSPDAWVCEVLPLVLQLTDHWLLKAAAVLEYPAAPQVSAPTVTNAKAVFVAFAGSYFVQPSQKAQPTHRDEPLVAGAALEP